MDLPFRLQKLLERCLDCPTRCQEMYELMTIVSLKILRCSPWLAHIHIADLQPALGWVLQVAGGCV